MPNGILIDIFVGQYGANALINLNGNKNVYYIGMSTNYDIGISHDEIVDWTILPITSEFVQVSNSFA